MNVSLNVSELSTEDMKGATEHLKIAIIGTGFSGLGMAIRLKQKGEHDFRIFEKEAGIGGTWRVNHYPGCACDVQSHLYSFSFAPNATWSRMFAPQPEIRDYLECCAREYAVRSHIRFNAEIRSLSWNNAEGRWHITTGDGTRYTARIVVSGMGGLAIPAYPSIPGLDRFQGKLFHSQQWDHDYDLRGKRVAVIGTGASAIQFIPRIQPEVERLDVYQRTAQWLMPKPDRAMSAGEKGLFRRLPLVQKALRGKLYWQLEFRVLGMAIDPRLMKLAGLVSRRHLHKQINDPDLRAKLSPDYAMGCKRILLSNDFYPAIREPNVDLLTTGIREITPNGIIAADGSEREVDAIILGTGFKATDPIPRGLVFGRGGQDLAELWKAGPEAYKGTCVSGFPNFFVLMGPNTGLGHNSMVYMIESQISYVLDAIRVMDERGLESVEVRQPEQERFNTRVQGELGHSVWNTGGCQSWYLHPVSGRNTSLWPGFTWKYRLQTRRFDSGAYRLTLTERGDHSGASLAEGGPAGARTQSDQP